MILDEMSILLPKSMLSESIYYYLDIALDFHLKS